MSTDKNGTAAEIAAEAGHFRSESIRQELKTGERMPLVSDTDLMPMPAGMQTSRPAFPEDGDSSSAAPAPSAREQR